MTALDRVPRRDAWTGPMTEDEYADLDALNPSLVEVMWQHSPAKFKYALDNPRADTDTFRLGRLFHLATMQPLLVAASFVAKPAGMNFATKEGKAWRAAQTATIIEKPADFNAALAMAAAVRLHPKAGAYFAPDGHIEQPVVWTDAETGLPCKTRPDYFDDGLLLDLKSARSALPREFGQQAYKLGYLIAMAMRFDALAAVGCKPKRVILLAVEKAAPHIVVPHVLSAGDIEIGRDDYRKAMRRIAECRKTGRWPGYGNDEEVAFALPKYAEFDDGDEETEQGGEWAAQEV